MRAWMTILAVGMLGVSLAGCDMPGSHQQQVAVAPPPCNCRQAPADMTAPPEPTEHLTRFSYAPRRHYVRHRYYAEAHYRPTYHRERYDIDRSQQSVDVYDYVSSSRVTRSEYSESEYSRSGYTASAYAQSGYAQGAYAGGYAGGYSNGRVVWVDGYGRGYFSNGPVTVAATMRGKRLETWHGYGVDCPNDGEPRGVIAP